MARKKAVGSGHVGLRVLRSFNNFKAGEDLQHELTPYVTALVNLGFLKVVGDGASEAGPAAADASDSGGGTESAPAESAPGAEPGAHFGAGGYGSSEG